MKSLVSLLRLFKNRRAVVTYILYRLFRNMLLREKKWDWQKESSKKKFFIWKSLRYSGGNKNIKISQPVSKFIVVNRGFAITVIPPSWFYNQLIVSTVLLLLIKFVCLAALKAKGIKYQSNSNDTFFCFCFKWVFLKFDIFTAFHIKTYYTCTQLSQNLQNFEMDPISGKNTKLHSNKKKNSNTSPYEHLHFFAYINVTPVLVNSYLNLQTYICMCFYALALLLSLLGNRYECHTVLYSYVCLNLKFSQLSSDIRYQWHIVC